MTGFWGGDSRVGIGGYWDTIEASLLISIFILFMNKWLLGVVGLAVIVGGVVTLNQNGVGASSLLAAAGLGFDQYGYNDRARIFNGLADGVDGTLDGKVWGSAAYAKDRLVMKWNAAWDACNAAGNNDASACAGAWTDNEWNGAGAGGSGEVWHYKIIWVGADGSASPYWKRGGYLVWGNYEVLMDQGVTLPADGSSAVHYWFAKATPNGYGSGKK